MDEGLSEIERSILYEIEECVHTLYELLHFLIYIGMFARRHLKASHVENIF